MPPFKASYTIDLFAGLASQIAVFHPLFPREKFLKDVFSGDWESLEMMWRVRQGAAGLIRNLPDSLEDCVTILLSAAPHCDFCQGLILTEFIVQKGLDNLPVSDDYLKRITISHTAEFAVRPFIEKYRGDMMDILLGWTAHPHEEVRRLASEGCRIRLPWGSTIQYLQSNPSNILPILTRLKNDPSQYVRKSVANNLNEISRTAPELAYTTACSWSGQTPETDWIVKHGCRTLMKQNYPGIRSLLHLESSGYLTIHHFKIKTPEIAMESDLEFTFTIRNDTSDSIKADIRYEITFESPAGRSVSRLYKISERSCPSGFLLMNRRHTMASSSGRKLYPGICYLHIVINGQRLASLQFHLSLPTED